MDAAGEDNAAGVSGPGEPEGGVAPFGHNVGDRAQIHLMGVDGGSKFRPGARQGSLAPARRPRRAPRPGGEGVEYWFTRGVVGPESEQIFMYDSFGNMIELHQVGTCRCTETARAGVAGSGR